MCRKGMLETMSSLQSKKWGTAFLSFVLVACMFSLFAFSTVYAKGRRTVKVAFFPMNGYHEKKADDSFSGMDVEYLDELCQFANWEIEYVECDSWDEALKLLSNKQVDLVGTAQYSAERAAIYQYADLSSGYTFGIIATNADSSLAYEDFEAMKEITFGMVKTYVRRDEFLHYLSDNGISSPKIREYNSTAKLQEALDNGEIDAMVHTFMEIKEGQRLIGRFAPRPFYYITYPGNDDVMRELNYAIADLKMDNPELETKLMNEFYQSRLDKTIVFTTEEKQYIADTQAITVGYFDGYYPFLYEDEGECRGLTRDLMEGAAAVAGLTLSWHKVTNLQEAYTALNNKTIDVLSYCAHAEKQLNEYQLSKLKDYAQIPLVLVMKKNRELSSIKTLATVDYLIDEASDIVDLKTTSLLINNTQQEGMEAVKDGKADAILCDGYLAEYLLSAEMSYYKLEVKSVLSGEHEISMAVRSNDFQLVGILNKTTLTIDARAVSDYRLERNVYSLSSVSQFVQDHSNTIITILLFSIITIILVARHMVRDAKKIQNLMYKDVEIDIGILNHLIYWGTRALLPERMKLQYAIAYFNIAHFQRYKVVYGWSNGQKLLVTIADALSQCVHGKGEVCAKADGDHFTLLMSTENGEILQRLRDIKQFIEERIYQDTENQIELQIGVYFIPPSSNDLRGAVVCASQAIDFLREHGGESIKVYDDSLEKAIRERHKREKLLDSVNIEENFVTYYQAKIDIYTEKIVGTEALVRFLDPTASGMVRSPGFFVPYYEQTGKITEIDFFILQSVCQMLRRRLDKGEHVVTVSCNFSRIHFTKPDFAKRFQKVLETYKIPKELIEVEITETLIMEEMQEKMAKQTLEDLHANGIRISIDDFGSGYSSLGVIEKIPASVIKLDRSFLLNQEDRARQVKIMKSIVDLAGDLGAQIVCEGVETEEDVKLMQEIGARVAQGYRYAKPVPEAEFERRVSENIAVG